LTSPVAPFQTRPQRTDFASLLPSRKGKNVCHLVLELIHYSIYGAGFFLMKGPRTTAKRLLCNPNEDDEDEQFFTNLFTINGAPVE
jgi:hypothetical protein